MDADDRAAQLYTVEYERAAERYENVYRSMWTIFSYLTAVAAGLLAFGSDRIQPDALVCIAASPLIFWFWTTYMPLDRYGNQTVSRLSVLERILNERYGVKLDHYTGYAHPHSIALSVVEAFANPYARGSLPPNAGLARRGFQTLRSLWCQVHRARFAIIAFFIALHIVVLYQGWAFYKSGQPLFR